ncbi:hypothetical protein GCM10010968_11370 [Agrococcus terreus]|uniref:Uncharacterized protein n=1 Tax=Agrococcus terreus TaxID=574649 RepID=A0ABQ2KFJ9_9MICO|nr:hypothetical protein GCM10010968_11370 [Agrococcus terreus]
MTSELVAVGGTSATAPMAVKVQAALSRVTCEGLRPSAAAIAASGRPSGRFTKREYAGAPLDDFCAVRRRAMLSEMPVIVTLPRSVGAMVITLLRNLHPAQSTGFAQGSLSAGARDGAPPAVGGGRRGDGV